MTDSWVTAFLDLPGGLPFCLVHSSPAPARRPPAATCLVDQVCLDIGPDGFEAETAFWAGLTGWTHSRSPTHAEFERLRPTPDPPLQFLLQRLTDPAEAVTAHLDLAVADRPAETSRHLGLGAALVAQHDDWTVLTDPAGSAYCLTDRPLP